MTALCRDYDFALFKFDSVCGPLRPDKVKDFIGMMKACRKYSPDLILLNHRLDLKEGLPHATTFLWEGEESYIDVHCANRTPAPHHRAGALVRGLVPGMKRLTEDHGVCLSSCMDGWEDELILHAFGRDLILAPEIYGNPWLLRDDEFPKLARYFQLHRKFRNILVKGMPLPETLFGPHAVSRGNGRQRLIAMVNLSWNTEQREITLDQTIGLDPLDSLEVRLFHPYEYLYPPVCFGETLSVSFEPFRAVLLYAGVPLPEEPALRGVAYQVRKNSPEKAELELLPRPGENISIALSDASRYRKAELAGKEVPRLLHGESVTLPHTGLPFRESLNRKLPAFHACSSFPDEIEKWGYEAAVFAADNNALEVRSLNRAGESRFPAIRAARDAFFNQSAFRMRGLWDRYLFDGDSRTGFWPSRRFGVDSAIDGGCLRIDLGQVAEVATLVLDCGDCRGLEPLLPGEGSNVLISGDLRHWESCGFITAPRISIEINRRIRFVKLPQPPSFLRSICGTAPNGADLDTTGWRVSNLFAPGKQIEKLWKTDFEIEDVAEGGYIAVALNGVHGEEGAYVAFLIDEIPYGCPDRAPSFPTNPYEFVTLRRDSGYTYYFPLSQALKGKHATVFVMGCDSLHLAFTPTAYLCCPPDRGRERIRLVLQKKPI
ncbi:MAG: hypothetical protein BWY31_04689 [Lentisphaerae bacterium ADurb.Bin242]|nr:MAG: hypothetical protein BWY31_04689 [Lentisphaerae bacterium ADurb.Bin242]